MMLKDIAVNAAPSNATVFAEYLSDTKPKTGAVNPYTTPKIANRVPTSIAQILGYVAPRLPEQILGLLLHRIHYREAQLSMEPSELSSLKVYFD